jgi:hypothetical protein
MLTNLADLSDVLGRTADSIDLIEEHEAMTTINAALDMAQQMLGAYRAAVYLVRHSDMQGYPGDMFSLITCAPKERDSHNPDHWIDAYGRSSNYPIKSENERGVWEYVYDENTPIWVTKPNHDKTALPPRNSPSQSGSDLDIENQISRAPTRRWSKRSQIKPIIPAEYNYADDTIETVITIPFLTKIEKQNVCWGMLNFDFHHEVEYSKEQFDALDSLAEHISSIEWKANAWHCTRLDTQHAVERFEEWCHGGAKKESVVHPYFGPPDLDKNKLDLFVLMPFSGELLPIYENHIKPVVSELGLVVARADEFVSVDFVISDVWNAICASRAIVADCTGQNANVFYEMGMAHVLGKPVILLTQEPNDIPFDLQHIRFIQYKYTPPGMRDLEATLLETIRSVLRIPLPTSRKS